MPATKFASKSFSWGMNLEDLPQQSNKLPTDLSSARIQFVRSWLPWNSFEKKYNPSELSISFPFDKFIADMGKAGIEVMGVVGNGYSRFLPQGVNTNDPEGYIKALARSSTEIVRHYKDSINIWQIENEPNWWLEHTASSWRHGEIWLKMGMQDRILSTLHGIVREEAPNAKITVNLESDAKKTNFKSYAKYCDVLGLDFYPNYSHSSPVDASGIKFAAIVKKQVSIPVYVAETGYPSGPRLLGYNVLKQAEYIKSACENSFGTDEIAGIGIWKYNDSYLRSFPDQENHFGLLSKEGKPKPAWKEYAEQIRKATRR